MSTITGNLIGGEIVTDAEEGIIEITDPADSTRTVGAVPSMGAADVERIMAAAEEGFRVWKNTGQIDRGEVLREAARRLRAESETLAALITSEMGKTLAEASVEVTKAADFFDYYAGFGRLPFGELLPDARPSTYTRVIHEPLGVVVMITPWNDPLLTPARKLGPALISGNAVVIKPATVAPLIVLELARILNESGLPAGALGTVTGSTSVVSDPMLEHASVKALTFTGSTSVGKYLQRKMAGRAVRVQTEMGGKNAVAVWSDADIDLAAENIVAGAFAQAGQRCTATSRVVAHVSVAEQLTEAILQKVDGLKAGSGTDSQTTLGPVVSQGAKADIHALIATALGQGAELLRGGVEEVEGTNPNGAFVRATVMNVAPGNPIWREEVFGPVVAILNVDSEEEMLEFVNDSVYGLSAAIFTRDLGVAERFLNGAETGQVSVNQPTSGWDVHHPFGGFRDSGSPFKEQGLDALHFYTRTKTVAVKSL